MEEIIYKSEYSKVCELVGFVKPTTQAAEDYCLNLEQENWPWCKKVLDKMIEEKKQETK